MLQGGPHSRAGHEPQRALRGDQVCFGLGPNYLAIMFDTSTEGEASVTKRGFEDEPLEWDEGSEIKKNSAEEYMI